MKGNLRYKVDVTIEETINLTGNGTVIVGFPAYLGVMDRSLAAFGLYVVLSAVALCWTDRLTLDETRFETALPTISRIVLRGLGVLLAGGFAYLVAIMAI